MKILVNMPSQHGGRPSGVARVIFCLLEELVKKTQHQFVLRSPWTKQQLPVALQTDRIEVVTVKRPKMMVFDIFVQAITVGFFCYRHRVDLVLNADPFGCPLGGNRRVTIVHDLYFKTIPEQTGKRARITFDIIYRVIVATSHKLICVSDATRNDLQKHYPRSGGKSMTIYSDGTLNADSGKHSGIPATIKGKFILCVGNATWNKNFGVLGRAFAEIGNRLKDVLLVQVGRDDNGDILDGIEEPETLKRVIRLNHVSDDELAALYRQAACLCVPSIYEGFCLPIVEAQRMGCPVICSNVSAMPEVAGKAALTFDPHRVESLVQVLDSFFADDELAIKLRQAGFDNVNRFSWARAAARYNEVFSELRP